MNSMVNLDVLVVYSAGVAMSASVEDSYSKHPFLIDSKQKNYNLSYAYFLQMCKKYGLKAGFTTSADITGPGTCKNYWTALSGNWIKVDHHAKSLNVFDKISPTSSVRATERQLLLSDDSVVPFNDTELFATFFDKLRTYKQLTFFAIPTVDIRSSRVHDIKTSLVKLRRLIDEHAHSGDFTTKVVLKDRFGAGGNHVYKINKDFIRRIRATMLLNKGVHFVMQPFLSFDKGYAYKKCDMPTDIRLIYHHGELLQCYVRMAKPRDFRCNEHQGGKLVYVTEDDIPEIVHTIFRKIVTRINKPQSLYALDFVVSNTGRAYFIEGNIGPGIDWDITKKVNERKSKQLIRSIVKELALRIHASITPVLPHYINGIEIFA